MKQRRSIMTMTGELLSYLIHPLRISKYQGRKPQGKGLLLPNRLRLFGNLLTLKREKV